MKIVNSTFENLSAKYGGAITLIDMKDSVSEIINNTFNNNQASSGGAIDLQNPGRVLLLNNNFTENKAVKLDKSWRDLDAGAIYYACSSEYSEEVQCEVVLRENRFINTNGD